MGEEENTTQNERQEALHKLVEMGMQQKDGQGPADKMREQPMDKMREQVMKVAEAEQLTSVSVLPAVVGGLLAAIVCGVIWGMIVIATEYEIGYMAWGVGVAAGFSVVMFSKGQKGTPLQVVAVASSLLGILIGKYLTFFHYLKEGIAQEHGAQAAAEISFLSGGVIRFFLQNVLSMSHPLDLLWIVLAVATAWRITKAAGVAAANNMTSPGT